MKRTSLLMTGIALILSLTLVSCGGYAKKGEFEKTLEDHRMDLNQKVQLAQDSATAANDKAEKALSATKGLDKMKEEILSAVDGKIDSSLTTAKSYNDEQIKLIAQNAANKAIADANSFAMAEDEKIKQLAKESAEKAMNSAMEANKKAQEAAKQAELAKELPKPGAIAIYTVYFDSGKANIKTEYITELGKAANAIKENPKAIVKIEGHADNTAVVYSKYGSNWVLSQVRAKAVMDYLVNKLGVPESSIERSLGFAEYKPAVSNDISNKWQNRRVEVIITE
jgi:chemotaxis protein MotB